MKEQVVMSNGNTHCILSLTVVACLLSGCSPAQIYPTIEQHSISLQPGNLESYGISFITPSATTGQEEEKQAVADRKPGTHPSHELQEYAGTYENPGYGTARIGFANGKLSFALNTLSAPLEHYHYDVFITPNEEENMLATTKLRFNTGVNGEIESLAIALQPDVADIVFRRIEEKKSAATNQE
jgi:hypothetical protein